MKPTAVAFSVVLALVLGFPAIPRTGTRLRTRTMRDRGARGMPRPLAGWRGGRKGKKSILKG